MLKSIYTIYIQGIFMSHFKLLTRLSFVSFACLAVYANTPSDDFIIEKENKTIEAILKADENIGTRSNKSLNEEKTLAMLCVVTNFILSEKEEVLDQPTEFNVTYIASNNPGTGTPIVTPSGTITSPDQKIEYIEVNGFRININEHQHTFLGGSFNGNTLNIDVKLEGKAVLENYSA